MLKISRILVNCCRNRMIINRSIHTQTTAFLCQADQMKGSEKYTPIYSFPYIRVLATINRMKLYQTYFSGLTIPSSVLCTYINLVRPDAILFVAALSVAGYLPLLGLSYLFQRFVGFIYYNREEDKVRVAFIDSWGKRKEVEMTRSDIVPFEDLPVSFTDGLFLNLQRFSTKDKLKINVKFGTILNKDLFNKVFK